MLRGMAMTCRDKIRKYAISFANPVRQEEMTTDGIRDNIAKEIETTYSAYRSLWIVSFLFWLIVKAVQFAGDGRFGVYPQDFSLMLIVMGVGYILYLNPMVIRLKRRVEMGKKISETQKRNLMIKNILKYGGEMI